MSGPRLTLVADDLTGALDSAAALVPAFGPLGVSWKPPGPDVLAGVFDTGLRENDIVDAIRNLSCYQPVLMPEPGRPVFYKLDSLLRGHAGAALAALLTRRPVPRIIIAPAFPAQGRVTRGGRQFWQDGTHWRPTGEDLPTLLSAAGLDVATLSPDSPPGRQATVYDAETDADLDRIVQHGMQETGAVLWAGSAGLAAALARALARPGDAMPAPVLHGPVLGLVGSDHPVTRDQLAQIGAQGLGLTPDAAATAAPTVAAWLQQGRSVIIHFDLARSTSRVEARYLIRAGFRTLLDAVPVPGLLFASGGETLRDIVTLVAAERLEVLGEWEPGMPVTRVIGGRWHGTMVLSKSGAFGRADCLARVLAQVTQTSTHSSRTHPA